MKAQYEAPNVLKIAAIGMDDRMRQLMNMAFQGPGKGACILASVESADMFIFNLDHMDGPSLWEKYHHAYPQRPSIVIALKNPGLKDAIFVEKPFRIETLLDTINAHKKKCAPEPVTNTPISTSAEPSPPLDSVKPVDYDDEHEFCGSNQDIDLNHLASLATIYYKPNEYLQEQIFYAARISKTDRVALQIAVKVNDKWELITFLPTLQGVFTTLSDFQLRVICTAPKYCTEVKVHRYNMDETNVLENGPRTKTSTQKIDPFLWKVALWTSHGRIPHGTNLSTPVKLQHWPNFTRIHTTPNCMKIATLLLDDARPLKVVAKVLNIPQRHVFSFYSAARALGITTSLNTTTVADTALPAKKHKQHSLLGRILNRLTGAVTN